MYIKMIIYVEKPKGIDQERRNLLELINNDSNVFFSYITVMTSGR